MYLLLIAVLFTTGCDYLMPDNGDDQDDAGEEEPTVIAHRGASSVAPENTLAAFSRAIALGADYFELDVQASRDDSLMVIHDAALDRTTDGRGQVSETTYAELRTLDAGSWFDPRFAGEKIPTLREALALAKGKIKVAVEIKADGIAEQVVQRIEAMGMEDQVIIFAFNFENIAIAKEANPAIPVLYLKGAMTREAITRTQRIDGEYVGAGGGNEITRSLIDYAHDRDIKVWRWTVNDVQAMKSLIEAGIDGIITDYPQRLTALLIGDNTSAPDATSGPSETADNE